MSSRNIIPKERLTAYERWELSSIDNTEEQQLPTKTFTTAQRVEQIHQQAEKQGFVEGYQDGKTQIHGEAKRLHELIAHLEEESKTLNQTVAQDLLALTLIIAKQMIRQSLKVNPELVLPVIREAISNLPQSNQPTLLILNPGDVELVRKHLQDQLTSSHIKVVEDNAIERGGCRITSSGTEIDGTLATRWRRIVNTLGQDMNWLDSGDHENT